MWGIKGMPGTHWKCSEPCDGDVTESGVDDMTNLLEDTEMYWP